MCPVNERHILSSFEVKLSFDSHKEEVISAVRKRYIIQRQLTSPAWNNTTKFV